jgi:hypothetical protein
MAKTRIILIGIWVAAALGVAVLALAPAFGAYGELRPILIPLTPETAAKTGVTHVGLVASPGRLWVVVSDRDGHLTRGVVIHDAIARFSGQAQEYIRPTAIRFVVPPATARWYDVFAREGESRVLAEVEYGPETGTGFEVRTDGRRRMLVGNPAFPTQVVRGEIADLVPPGLGNQLVSWCEIGPDLARISRHHDTYQSGLATRVGNALSALCCMSVEVGCANR